MHVHHKFKKFIFFSKIESASEILFPIGESVCLLCFRGLESLRHSCPACVRILFTNYLWENTLTNFVTYFGPRSLKKSLSHISLTWCLEKFLSLSFCHTFLSETIFQTFLLHNLCQHVPISRSHSVCHRVLSQTVFYRVVWHDVCDIFLLITFFHKCVLDNICDTFLSNLPATISIFPWSHCNAILVRWFTNSLPLTGG